MSDQHTFSVRLNEYGSEIIVHCPYEWDDAKRPCWPHHEDGDGEFTIPDDPPQTICTYEQCVENLACDDLVQGETTLALPPDCVHIEWTDGYMALHLDELVHWTKSESGDE